MSLVFACASGCCLAGATALSLTLAIPFAVLAVICYARELRALTAGDGE